jgi:hypothetical protein
MNQMVDPHSGKYPSCLVIYCLGNFQQPGLFFRYDISPYSVHYKQERKSFPHFLTALCAVIGGVWTVFGLLTSSVWYFEQILTKNRSSVS